MLSRRTALDQVTEAISISENVTESLGNMAGIAPETQPQPLISADDFNQAMRREIKEEYIRQYIHAKGGRDQMTAVDWGSIGGMLKEQYGYLNVFTEELRAGEVTPGQAATRARMYARSAREAYERGFARSQGIPEGALPAMPGDGSTICLVNCGCAWSFEPVRDEDGNTVAWHCYWNLGPTEHCPDCLARREEWYPYVIEI